MHHEKRYRPNNGNKAEFEEFGRLAFETRKGEPLPHGGFAKSTRYALLNEDQSYFLLVLTRNTERTKRLKVDLVKAFGLDAGQRPDLALSLRAKVTAANVIAGDIVQRCIEANLDHKTTYQKVKQAIFALAEPVRGPYQPLTQNRTLKTVDSKNPEL